MSFKAFVLFRSNYSRRCDDCLFTLKRVYMSLSNQNHLYTNLHVSTT